MIALCTHHSQVLLSGQLRHITEMSKGTMSRKGSVNQNVSQDVKEGLFKVTISRIKSCELHKRQSYYAVNICVYMLVCIVGVILNK